MKLSRHLAWSQSAFCKGEMGGKEPEALAQVGPKVVAVYDPWTWQQTQEIRHDRGSTGLCTSRTRRNPAGEQRRNAGP